MFIFPMKIIPPSKQNGQKIKAMQNETESIIIMLMIIVFAPMLVLFIYLAYSMRKSYKELQDQEREINKYFNDHDSTRPN